jgi:hypothetical protein
LLVNEEILWLLFQQQVQFPSRQVGIGIFIPCSKILIWLLKYSPFQSIPQRADLNFNLTEVTGINFVKILLASLRKLRRGAGDDMTALKWAICNASENQQIPVNLTCFSAALTFVTEKWMSVADQTQELISETKLPDGANLPLFRTMI